MLAVRGSDILICMQITHDLATCMYYTGVDSMTGKSVQVARHPQDREARRKRVNQAVRGDYFHSVAKPAAGELAADDESGVSAGAEDAGPATETGTRELR